MRIRRIRLWNFRNYNEADIPLDGDAALLYGKNGQGKTNVLEAVFLCCTGRSHRTVRERELIRDGQDTARILLDIERKDGPRTVEVTLYAQKRRDISVNGIPISRLGELMGHVNGVFFSPEDLRLVKDGPSERRRFLDMEIAQVRPAYFYALQEYSRALTQRNSLLKSIAENPSLRDTLPAWDQALARPGALIIAARQDFIQRMTPMVLQIHAHLSQSAESLGIEYRQNPDGACSEQALADALREHTLQDIARGQTNVGPHRDDILLLLDGHDARQYASQGQQRTIALAMKLSQIDMMRQESGEAPVLLLDDVMSELDAGRQELLINYAPDVQTLITAASGADALMEQSARLIQSLFVEHGTVMRGPQKSADLEG